jgi:hypothetical protein
LRFWQILTQNLAKLVELTLEKRKISNEFPISLWKNGKISPQKKSTDSSVLADSSFQLNLSW